MIFAPISMCRSPFQEIDRSKLFTRRRGRWAATDCPVDEYGAWEETYPNSCRTLQSLLKQPRRAVKSAAADLRRLNRVELDRAGILNEFQVEDVREHTSEEELKWHPPRRRTFFYDVERYQKQMAEACRNIRRRIETRMTRRTTVVLGLTILCLYLGAAFRFCFTIGGQGRLSFWGCPLCAQAGCCLVAVSFISLLFLRGTRMRSIGTSTRGCMRSAVKLTDPWRSSPVISVMPAM